MFDPSDLDESVTPEAVQVGAVLRSLCLLAFEKKTAESGMGYPRVMEAGGTLWDMVKRRGSHRGAVT